MVSIETDNRDLRTELEPRKYSRPVRLAILLALSAVLWGAVIVGGWRLCRLLA
jgi:hypothetical protein